MNTLFEWGNTLFYAEPQAGPRQEGPQQGYLDNRTPLFDSTTMAQFTGAFGVFSNISLPSYRSESSICPWVQFRVMWSLNWC